MLSPDVDSIRYTKTVNGTTHSYIYAGGTLLQEKYGSTVLNFLYDANGRPYAIQYSTNSGSNFTHYYYITNLQGDVIGIIDGNRNRVVTYTYDSWGMLISTTGSMASSLGAVNPLRYRGYYYDTETSLYYLQSRYYDPQVGRFINADGYASTGQGILGYNMYAYCQNCPCSYTDSAGNYSRDAAIDYAEEWAKKKNDDYYYYSNGDCANFVSQCLRAGGIEDTDGWYHHEKTEKALDEYILNPLAWIQSKRRYNWSSSKSWRYANELYLYFSDRSNGYINGDIIPIRSKSEIAGVAQNGGIQPGDLLFFSDNEGIFHATIITQVGPDEIYYSAHTARANNKPLSRRIAGYTVFIVRIDDNA